MAASAAASVAARVGGVATRAGSAASSAPRFIDIGINLADAVFQGKYRGKRAHESDLDQVLERAWSVGMTHMIITGGSLNSARDAMKIAKMDDRLFVTVGCHPCHATEFEKKGAPDRYYDALLKLTKEGMAANKVVAVGECGLDYARLQFAPVETQLKYFERQFDLAEATGLPIFLHSREADEDFLRLIKKHRHRFSSGVVHSYTGSLEEALKLIELDLYIGINGCSLKTEENVAVAAALPLDRIMLETDGPYCDVRKSHAGYKFVREPVQAKRKEKFQMGMQVKGRNEPCNIVHVLDVVAGARGMDPLELADICHKNTLRLFLPHLLEDEEESKVPSETKQEDTQVKPKAIAEPSAKTSAESSAEDAKK